MIYNPVLGNRGGIFVLKNLTCPIKKKKGMMTMSENSLMEARLTKLNYVSNVTNPYPERFEKTHEICKAAALQDGETGIRTAGRIMSIRKMGKLSFLTIADIAGKIQVAVKRDIIGESEYEFFKKGFDIGDFLGVEGEIFTTQAGEKTIRASKIIFLGKSLRPLPEKFHGINDSEICYRQRYLDLCMSDETKTRFLKKFQFIKEIRRYLEDNDYIHRTYHLSNRCGDADCGNVWNDSWAAGDFHSVDRSLFRDYNAQAKIEMTVANQLYLLIGCRTN